MTTLRITIKPTRLVKSGQMYEARLNGRLLCENIEPFFSAARVLIDEGYDPTARLEMTREGRDQVDLFATLHVAAVLSAYDGENRGPSIAPYGFLLGSIQIAWAVTPLRKFGPSRGRPMIPMHALSPTRRASSLGAVALPLPQPATLIPHCCRDKLALISGGESGTIGDVVLPRQHPNLFRAVSTPVHSAERRYAYRPYRPPLVHARSATEGCSRRRSICFSSARQRRQTLLAPSSSVSQELSRLAV